MAKSDDSVFPNITNDKPYYIDDDGVVFFMEGGAYKEVMKLGSPRLNTYNLHILLSNDKKFLIVVVDDLLKIMDYRSKAVIYTYKNEYGFGRNILLDESNIYFSSLSGIIQSRKMSDGSLNWYVEYNEMKEKKDPVISFYGSDSMLVFYGDGEFFKVAKHSGRVDFRKNFLKDGWFEKNYVSLIDFTNGELSFIAKVKKKKMLRKINIVDLLEKKV